MLAALLPRCDFGAPRPVRCGCSGGADSLALVALAVAAGLEVTAVHVDHGLRPGSGDEAAHVATAATRLGARFETTTVAVADGPNLEARARQARRHALGHAALTGHTADDRAETVLINLLRGAGGTGLSAMGPSPIRPILALRRRETRALCADLGLRPLQDPSNDDPRFVRNRVRHELLPLLDDIAGRDMVPLLGRTADVLASERRALDAALDGLVTDDARVIAALAHPVATAAVRRWLLDAGIRADRAGVERVVAVARGSARSCQLAGGVRVERHLQRLRILAADRLS
ncbi:MAG: tRNA lysidine(34) synthetase TilS [Desertimonas sp.]